MEAEVAAARIAMAKHSNKAVVKSLSRLKETKGQKNAELSVFNDISKHSATVGKEATRLGL